MSDLDHCGSPGSASIQTGTRDEAPRQACRDCAGVDLRPVTVTASVVYLRCRACGCVWTIPQRRSVLRPTDPSQF